MKQDKQPAIEPEKAPLGDEHIYFSMNMPDWFINKPVDEKCDIVRALVDQLKDEKPITPEQKKKLFSI